MMGANDYGQLGVQNNVNYADYQSNALRTGSPCLVETLKHHRVEKLACGKNFTIVITMNAEQQVIAASRGDQRVQTTHVYSWGRNDFGQLGHQ
jgi:alpha-tubulin suppressor-like RCC1 family protein